MENVMAVKYVFVTGGVVSGPGKGINSCKKLNTNQKNKIQRGNYEVRI
jgi:CTP synthase (UTP-ammonia lyase)